MLILLFVAVIMSLVIFRFHLYARTFKYVR